MSPSSRSARWPRPCASESRKQVEYSPLRVSSARSRRGPRGAGRARRGCRRARRRLVRKNSRSTELRSSARPWGLAKSARCWVMTSSAHARWRVRRAHSFSHAPAAGVSSGFHASSIATNARPAHGPPRSSGCARWWARRRCDVAVDEVDQRQHHRPGQRVRQPGEIEQHQRRAGRDRGRLVGQPRRRAVVDVGVQALGEPPQLGGDAGVAVARGRRPARARAGAAPRSSSRSRGSSPVAAQRA